MSSSLYLKALLRGLCRGERAMLLVRELLCSRRDRYFVVSLLHSMYPPKVSEEVVLLEVTTIVNRHNARHVLGRDCLMIIFVVAHSRCLYSVDTLSFWVDL